jgi:hypothetical protein
MEAPLSPLSSRLSQRAVGPDPDFLPGDTRDDLVCGFHQGKPHELCGTHRAQQEIRGSGEICSRQRRSHEKCKLDSWNGAPYPFRAVAQDPCLPGMPCARCCWSRQCLASVAALQWLWALLSDRGWHSRHARAPRDARTSACAMISSREHSWNRRSLDCVTPVEITNLRLRDDNLNRSRWQIDTSGGIGRRQY